MKEAIDRVKTINQDENISSETQEFHISKKEKKKLKQRGKKKADRGMRPITDFATSGKPEATNATDTVTAARQSFAAGKRKKLTESGEKSAEKKGKKSDSVS